jgi:hypothetical protein
VKPLLQSIALAAFFVLPASLVAAGKGRELKIPDFTQGDKIPEGAKHDWNLGATGLRGWIFCDQLVTSDARQIAVTQVEKGSPAEGVLAVGDVILGVGGKPFSHDPRTELGKALTLAEAVKELEGRQREATRAVREASEQDLALQAKLTTLQETISRESQRVERIKRDATFAEEQSRLAAADAEGRIAEFTRMEQEAITRAEAARRDLVKLEPKQHELAAADAQLRQFQEIERRLRSQLEELEEKHEVMRRGLPTDEATVMLFANDLIKRIDLIDILIQRYASEGGGVDQQLRTLRAAFEDILHQHSVIEFDVAANTEIDVSLRQRIAVIESEPGDAKPRIVASFRPGFVYAPAEGREVVLRKVEVKTSSR